ncbi:hypothetical protein BDQ17DRAFT_1368895 [Cyathus striatus]|nr:hypothetical protein BDQ17DRAFT_1368895 [Cyathus striatus]
MSANSLGKRMEREEDETHGYTLFVSNLPYTATSVDLQTLFSDYAPVRSAFVVTEQGTGVSKGVGYVSFAIKEDAESVLTKISEDGLLLAGRKLRVQFADKKDPTRERTEKNTKTTIEPAVQKPRPPPRSQAPPHLPHDPLAIRTIVISGLPPSLDSKVLWKKIRKYDGAEMVEWPFKIGEIEDPTKAHVLFSNPEHAQNAVNKLHAHVFKGSLLSVELKKRLDNLTKPQKKASEQGSALVAPNGSSRLIVRNIPFSATEQDLRSVFLPYGPVFSIRVPIAEQNAIDIERGTVSNKGFAFVWMYSRKDAQRALEGCNGMVMRAGSAEELVSAKQKKKKQRRLELKEKKGVKEEREEGRDDGDEELLATNERIIAVDWALSKDKWEEEKAKHADDAMSVDEEDDSGSDGSSDSDSDDGSDAIGLHERDEDASSDDDDGSSADGDSDGEEPVKPQLPPPEVGRHSTEEELRTLFRAFGPLRYARITMDPATGRSRGTGFACFWNKEDADKVIEQGEMLRVETHGTAPLAKKNPFKLPSILTPDPSSSLAQSLVLHGRTLDVVRAVTRDQAGKLKEVGEKMREKADKRNLYLLREGVILPNTPAADTLTPADVERRTSSFNARRALLKSNPSLFISRTRLSVRQIPVFVTERMLKRMALHAIKTFDAEVKKGTRTGLTEDELEDRPSMDATEPEDQESKRAKKRPTKGLKQTKIVRQQERVDPVTGKGKSKGYGFIELHSHADALRVLRWANNNPEVAGLFESWWKDELANLIKIEKAKPQDTRDDVRLKRMKDELENGAPKKAKGALVVEFSIENVQVVQRRSNMQKESLAPVTKPDGSPKKREERKSSDDERSPKKRRPSLGKDDERSPKKRRTSEPSKPSSKAKAESASKADDGKSAIGSIIGRKRKERKGSKKGGR